MYGSYETSPFESVQGGAFKMSPILMALVAFAIFALVYWVILPAIRNAKSSMTSKAYFPPSCVGSCAATTDSNAFDNCDQNTSALSDCSASCFSGGKHFVCPLKGLPCGAATAFDKGTHTYDQMIARYNTGGNTVTKEDYGY